MTWHLVYTKPRKESLALEKLSEQGLMGYLPMKPMERIRRGKRQVLQEPLFHRYLFIEADDRFLMRRHAIRSTPGVSHLLQIGETDASVDDELIGIIRSLEAGHQDQVEAYFKPNRVVKITQGIYHDLEAIFVEGIRASNGRYYSSSYYKPIPVSVSINTIYLKFNLLSLE